MDKSTKFLKKVVGEAGSEALCKAMESHPELTGSLLPRVIYSWVNSKESFKDNIPGTKNYIEFKKTEGGYNGALDLDTTRLEFNSAGIFSVVGGVSIALEIDTALQKSIKDNNLVNLGKNIDILVKSIATKKPSTVTEIRARAKHKLTKGEDDGSSKGFAPHGKFAEPIPPTPPTPNKLVQEEQQFKTALNVKKSESESRCGGCSMRFFKNGSFVGCYCTRELAGDVTVLVKSEGYELNFGPSWNNESIQHVITALKDPK